MILGVYAATSTTQHLLLEQFTPQYTVHLLESSEEAQDKLMNTTCHLAVVETPCHLELLTPATSIRFTKPLARENLFLKLQHHENTLTHVQWIGPYVFDPDQRLLKGKKTIVLREKEAEILTFLYQCGPKGASKEALLEHVWSYNQDIETRTLESHIYQLRQKIEATPENPSILIRTAHGYTLKRS